MNVALYDGELSSFFSHCEIDRMAIKYQEPPRLCSFHSNRMVYSDDCRECYMPCPGPIRRKKRMKLKGNLFKKTVWKILAQPGELKFHKHENDRTRDDFMDRASQEFVAWGFKSDDYAGKVVMDVGCGSRLRTLFFQDATLIALDPLANKFIAEVPWCDLSKATEVYSLPAESHIDGLDHRVDLLICMNVLDHCFDTEAILTNMDRYLANRGKFLLSVDVDHHLHHLHPNLVTREGLLDWFSSNGYGFEVLDTSSSPYGMGRKFTVLATKYRDDQ